ncbi:alginate O-acetyltransferase AlgF [Rhizobium sp. NRK18]|uniref:alginate O-acetyltransferase AlgF n=1 Tax=Rhizobium sp. NRK18 TaxID=2964667 RepID=UPI0021C404D0|nr:alginate O-acetyltransferase AlgF [Rhizobium sp. NRK18]MCQ2005929.1 alginate O-acetyltransferase AlgF [Rhizobium sp. NRK18]
MKTILALGASAIFSITALVGAASAQDAGLYAKPIDPNSAFVRVISPGSSIASVKGSSFSGLTDGVSPYVAVDPGDINVSSSLTNAKVEAGAGKFYTAILTQDGTKTVVDDMSKNPAKASLTLYNLSDAADASVFVPQAKSEAISKVEMGGSKSVALRAPLKLDLVVKASGKDVADLKTVEFKRGSGITVIVTGSGDKLSAVAVPSTIAR